MMFSAQQRVNFRCQVKSCTVFAEERRHADPNGSTKDNSKDRKMQVLFLTLNSSAAEQPQGPHAIHDQNSCSCTVAIPSQQQNVSIDHRLLFSSLASL